MFDKFYKNLESNTTNKNHICSYSGQDLGALVTQRVFNSVKERQFLIKSRKKTVRTEEQHKKRIEAILDAERNVIPKVGLKDIKAVELYKKFYPLIPDEHKVEFLKMSPPPSLAVMDLVREERNKKAREKCECKRLPKAAATDVLVPATVGEVLVPAPASVATILAKSSAPVDIEDQGIFEEETI